MYVYVYVCICFAQKSVILKIDRCLLCGLVVYEIFHGVLLLFPLFLFHLQGFQLLIGMLKCCEAKIIVIQLV